MKYLPILFFISFFISFQLSIKAQKPEFIMDMVHNNPGEALTKSAFTQPEYLKQNEFNTQVVNDFVFPTAAVTFDDFDPTIFPKGSRERAWTDSVSLVIKKNIAAAHAAGLKVYYFTDIVVLPKRLVQKYKDEICDKNGNISFDRPLTLKIHRILFDELFSKFPDLDGLVIRTGETYLNNVPFHTGNDPITDGPSSHIRLLRLLRGEVCVKHNKTIIYRTWSFGGMHDNPDYYLKVTDSIQPHKNLVFSIKHVRGDYQRTYPFNPCLGIGKHRQVVEVQCQREYEGKGAYPNYVMNGVINGFEEYDPNQHPNCLNDIKNNPNFAGVYSWSRGGGWVGPYITNEIWPRLNAFVLSDWANHQNITENQAFNHFMDNEGIVHPESRKAFRELCLLSAKAVLRGHMSAILSMKPEWAFWMRDQFLAGIEPPDSAQIRKFPSEGFLFEAFNEFYKKGELQIAVGEKYEAVKLWKKMVELSQKIYTSNPADDNYIRTSTLYGLYLHKIIASGWNVMALGFSGDKRGSYDKPSIKKALNEYDTAWIKFKNLKNEQSSCATLYQPNAFIYVGPAYCDKKGMGYSVNKYRKLCEEKVSK